MLLSIYLCMFTAFPPSCHTPSPTLYVHGSEARSIGCSTFVRSVGLMLYTFAGIRSSGVWVAGVILSPCGMLERLLPSKTIVAVFSVMLYDMSAA